MRFDEAIRYRFLRGTTATAFILGTSLCSVARAQTVIDACDSTSRWKVLPSDGVEAAISVVECKTANEGEGKALRLDFDFRKGSGFVVLRHDFAQTLAENFRFAFDIRGEAPMNQLEFKLVDAAGDSVWWVRRGEFEFPAAWSHVAYKKRHFQFAWGPSGGAPLENTSAIELAVAANEGGKGYLLLDQLTYEPLPAAQDAQAPIRVRAILPSGGTPIDISQAGSPGWHTAQHGDAPPALQTDFGAIREIGGLVIDWDERDFPRTYAIDALDAAGKPLAHFERQRTRGGREYLRLEPLEAQSLKFTFGADSAIGVQRLRVLPVEFAESLNAAYELIARDAPRGRYPRYFLGEQAYWTVVGVPGDRNEALIDTDGAVEISRRGPRLEPFLYVDGKLLTWADAEITQSLEDSYLPLPRVERKHGDLTLTIRPVTSGTAGDSRIWVGYEIGNHGPVPRKGVLFLAARPFQVLPPWQQLNLTGGAIPLPRIVSNDQLVILGKDGVGPWQRAEDFRISSFDDGDVTEFLAAGQLPSRPGIENDPVGASGAWRFDFDVQPGDTALFVMNVPLSRLSGTDPWAISPDEARKRFDASLDEAKCFWHAELDRVQLSLPPSARHIADTFRTTQAWTLINADGDATQPGSRTYERSWIRDGAVTATTWLYTGRPERAIAFADWYAKHLYENGKVPCVVDHRGPDPVPEYDSNGEFLYLLWRVYEFTGDKAFLERHMEQVTKAVDFIDELRKQRMTDAYRNGTPEQRACFGLVPESISHEGYSAKPMHSYWDDLWVLRGLKDAVRLASALGRGDLMSKWTPIRDEFRSAVGASLRLAMKNKGIDFIPGCVELGDFDATSTAIALFPCSDSAVPEKELRNTFERYWKFADDRRGNRVEWRDYTPYELRNIGALIRLGQVDRAHELLDFFLRDQRPQAWNHWAEVVWRDPSAPKFIGDLPHTWVGAEFLTTIRNMFVYEDEDADRLVLAAGIRPPWLTEGDGVAISSWPTVYGPLSYALKQSGKDLIATLNGSLRSPAGGIDLVVPGHAPIESVEIDGKAGSATGRNVRIAPDTRRVVVRFR